MAKTENRHGTLVQGPFTGDGNPLTLYALSELLKAGDIQHDLLLLEWIAKLTAPLHKSMTESKRASKGYTRYGEILRYLALLPTGLLSTIETRRRINHPYDSLLAVQEHPLGGIHANTLKKRYPHSRTLYIPDVLGKRSARHVVLQSEINVSVWNRHAYEKFSEDPEIKRRDIQVHLLEPHVLPLAFVGDHPSADKEGTIVVKASGSDMPRSYTEAFLDVFSKSNDEYEIYLPTTLYSNQFPDGITRGMTLKERSLFYAMLLGAPQIVFSYPSEMVGVMAALRRLGICIQYFMFPPRGDHEEENSQYAEEMGIGIPLSEISTRSISNAIALGKEMSTKRDELPTMEKLRTAKQHLTDDLRRVVMNRN